MNRYVPGVPREPDELAGPGKAACVLEVSAQRWGSRGPLRRGPPRPQGALGWREAIPDWVLWQCRWLIAHPQTSSWPWLGNVIYEGRLPRLSPGTVPALVPPYDGRESTLRRGGWGLVCVCVYKQIERIQARREERRRVQVRDSTEVVTRLLLMVRV